MNQEFSTISDILNDKVFDFAKGSYALKYSAVFSFWPQIAGKKYEKSSKPYAIKFSKMYVSCENSYVLQELMMYKSVLLKKIKPYCEPLNIEISDIIFDYKSWGKNAVADAQKDDFPVFYDDEKIDKIEIDLSEFSEVFARIDAGTNFSPEQKKKLKERIIKLKKAQILRSR